MATTERQVALNRARKQLRDAQVNLSMSARDAAMGDPLFEASRVVEHLRRVLSGHGRENVVTYDPEAGIALRAAVGRLIDAFEGGAVEASKARLAAYREGAR